MSLFETDAMMNESDDSTDTVVDEENDVVDEEKLDFFSTLQQKPHELFEDQYETPHVSFQMEDRREIYPVRSKAFRNFLVRSLMARGEPTSRSSLQRDYSNWKRLRVPVATNLQTGVLGGIH